MPYDPALVKRVTNVHNDDIHGISVVDENHIVSGSKDATVKLFDLAYCSAKLISFNAPQTQQNLYEHWVTAIDIFSDASVIVGHRNGYLLRKDVFTDAVFTDIFMQDVKIVSQSKNKCKQRNEPRITGIKCLTIGNHQTALIGMSQGEFIHYDFGSNKVLGSYSFEHPEWFYGFCQIDSTHVAAIHAGSLLRFKFNIISDAGGSRWKLLDSIFTEEKSTPRPKQRSLISSVSPMNKELPCATLILSNFDGTTKVVDTASKRVIHDTKEHEGLVWQTAPFSPTKYISCAEDATVKLWDLRAGQNSMHTYGDHPGRVSTIAVLSDVSFVAGTCAKDFRKDKNKGQFFFYDIRRSSAPKLFPRAVPPASSDSTPALLATGASVPDYVPGVEQKLTAMSLKGKRPGAHT